MMELYPQMTYPDSFNHPDAPYKDMLELRDVRYNRKVKEQKDMEEEMKDNGNLGVPKGKGGFQMSGRDTNMVQ